VDTPFIGIASPDIILGAGLGDSLMALRDRTQEASTDDSLPTTVVASMRYHQANGPQGGFDRLFASGALGISAGALLRLGGGEPYYSEGREKRAIL